MARRPADVPLARRALLEAGTAATRDLAECLAIDTAALMAACFPGIGAGPVRAEAGAGVASRERAGIVARMRAGGATLAAALPEADLLALLHHPSDTVRGWAAFAVALRPRAGVAAQVAAMAPFADDPHFAVREWAWLALRPHVVADTAGALAALLPWARHTSERMRRFASEATRPRGVWCAHLAPLKADPSPGLALLEPLHADPSRYVQDSVGNWLNDAAKDNPGWVRGVAAAWAARSPAPATRRILARATCSLGPRG